MSPIADTPPTDPLERFRTIAGGLAAGVAAVWMRLLSALARAVQGLGCALTRYIRAWRSRSLAARDYFLDPDDVWLHQDGVAISAAAAVGLRLFVVGMLATVGLALATGGVGRVAVITSGIEAVWAAARYAILVALVPSTALPRARLTAAYLAGLAPFAVGATALLRTAALIASGLLTFRGLTAAGLRRRTAAGAAVFAFGGQMGVVALGWLLRAAIALFVG